MTATGDGGGVRLAELIAALSLGIDLGFGQPMEHVVRQTWIALRLAEQLALDPDERSIVYYTSLLTNVGCHTDAHEQARWFGDDIALKGDKYIHGLHGVRSAVAGLRRLGAGQPVLHRFRIGLNFALSGHRDLDDMVARHSSMAQALATEIGLPGSVQEAVGAAYEQWDGKGWPNSLRPWPKSTGTSWISSTSTTPARSASWATAAPCIRTSRSPAARLACSTQDAMPDVT